MKTSLRPPSPLSLQLSSQSPRLAEDDVQCNSSVPVPETLARYQVEVASLTDYDSLLTGGVR